MSRSFLNPVPPPPALLTQRLNSQNSNMASTSLLVGAYGTGRAAKAFAVGQYLSSQCVVWLRPGACLPRHWDQIAKFSFGEQHQQQQQQLRQRQRQGPRPSAPIMHSPDAPTKSQRRGNNKAPDDAEGPEGSPKEDTDETRFREFSQTFFLQHSCSVYGDRLHFCLEERLLACKVLFGGQTIGDNYNSTYSECGTEEPDSEKEKEKDPTPLLLAALQDIYVNTEALAGLDTATVDEAVSVTAGLHESSFVNPSSSAGDNHHPTEKNAETTGAPISQQEAMLRLVRATIETVPLTVVDSRCAAHSSKDKGVAASARWKQQQQALGSKFESDSNLNRIRRAKSLLKLFPGLIATVLDVSNFSYNHNHHNHHHNHHHYSRHSQSADS